MSVLTSFLARLSRWIDDVAAGLNRFSAKLRRGRRVELSRAGGWRVLGRRMAQRRGAPARRAAAAPRAGPLCRPHIRANADALCAKPGRCHARALTLRHPDARTAARRQSVSRRHRPLATRSPDALERERRRLRLELASRRRPRSNRCRSRGHSERADRSDRAGARCCSGGSYPHIDDRRGRRRARFRSSLSDRATERTLVDCAKALPSASASQASRSR